MKIQITEQDFESLWVTSMEWGTYWQDKAERFTDSVSYDWAQAYWFNSYPALILARAFLTEQGHETQLTFDEGMDNWLLLTNYERKSK